MFQDTTFKTTNTFTPFQIDYLYVFLSLWSNRKIRSKCLKSRIFTYFSNVVDIRSQRYYLFPSKRTINPILNPFLNLLHGKNFAQMLLRSFPHIITFFTYLFLLFNKPAHITLIFYRSFVTFTSFNPCSQTILASAHKYDK